MIENPVSDEAYYQTMLQRRESNLLYFKDAYPAIYNTLIKLSPTKTVLDINRTTDTMELTVDGHAFYDGDAARFSDEEVDGFLNAFHSGHQISGMTPLFKATTIFPDSLIV